MDFTKIANDLKRLKCPIHGQSPKIESKGKDPAFSTCCEDFGRTVMSAFKKNVELAMAEEVKNVFKKR